MQAAIGLQFLQHPPGHLPRAADQPRQLLPRHAQLGAVGMAHRLGLAGQVVQGAGDAVGDVQEGQAPGLPAGIEQPPRELRADGVHDRRGVVRQGALEQLVEPLVADLGQFGRHPRAQDHLAGLVLDEQAHLADEFAGAEVAQHQFAAVVLLGDDAHRTADDEVHGAGRIAGPEHLRARWIAPAVAVGEESFDGRGGRRHRVCGATIAADQGHRAGFLHGWGGGALRVGRPCPVSKRGPTVTGFGA